MISITKLYLLTVLVFLTSFSYSQGITATGFGQADISKYKKAWSNQNFEVYYRDVWAVDQTARYYAIKNLTPRRFSRVDFGVEVTCQEDDPANNETKLTFFEELPAFGTVKVQLSSTWCTGGHASMKIWLINMALEKEVEISDGEVAGYNRNSNSTLSYEQTMAAIAADQKRRTDEQLRWQREAEAEQKRKRAAQFSNSNSTYVQQYNSNQNSSKGQQSITRQQQTAYQQQQSEQILRNQQMLQNEINRINRNT